MSFTRAACYGGIGYFHFLPGCLFKTTNTKILFKIKINKLKNKKITVVILNKISTICLNRPGKLKVPYRISTIS